MKYLLQLFIGELTVWIDQLYKATDELTNRYGVSLVKVLSKTEILFNSIAILFLAKFPNKFCKVICYKAIVICKVLRSELRNLPPRNITVRTSGSRISSKRI